MGATYFFFMAPESNPKTVTFYEKHGVTKGKLYWQFGEDL